MKRYLLFGFDGYYPEGGWNDFRSSHDTVEEALATVTQAYDLYHVVDTHDEKVCEYGRTRDLARKRGELVFP